jgi:phosphatidate cytidylyltransferase
VRAASALVLGPVAIVAAWLCGLPFLLLCALASVGIWWEWAALCGGPERRGQVFAGAASLGVAAIALAFGWFGIAIGCLGIGAVVVAIGERTASPAIVGAGILYAGTMLVAPFVLRNDPRYGFVAIIFLFAVVWTTDIAAYFAGRTFGGPKLAPRLSPKKTWSGALGGAIWAVMAAGIVAIMGGLPRLVVAALVGLVLSVASQAGDLFESALKRHYGAKDASQLIPGHGGLMDRLDGFIVAALLAAIVGLVRGGTDGAARGFLVW